MSPRWGLFRLNRSLQESNRRERGDSAGGDYSVEERGLLGEGEKASEEGLSEGEVGGFEGFYLCGCSGCSVLGSGEGLVLSVGVEGLGAEVFVLEQEGTQASRDEAGETVVGFTFASCFGLRLVHLRCEGLCGVVVEAEDEIGEVGGYAEECTAILLVF